jgi:hypothetical protein
LVPYQATHARAYMAAASLLRTSIASDLIAGKRETGAVLTGEL